MKRSSRPKSTSGRPQLRAFHPEAEHSTKLQAHFWLWKDPDNKFGDVVVFDVHSREEGKRNLTLAVSEVVFSILSELAKAHRSKFVAVNHGHRGGTAWKEATRKNFDSSHIVSLKNMPGVTLIRLRY